MKRLKSSSGKTVAEQSLKTKEPHRTRHSDSKRQPADKSSTAKWHDLVDR
jgi:hypothetical protein